jgi:hypothetical protein
VGFGAHVSVARGACLSSGSWQRSALVSSPPVLSQAFAAVFGLLLGLSCSVRFPPDAAYRCSRASDCGGEGWVCAPRMPAAVCCLPSGDELCDGKDNDCNGVTDDTGRTEVCNGLDDDCNGRVDEGFELTRDLNNCGRCGNACRAAEFCAAGRCTKRFEASCTNLSDDDDNGLVDCADPTCADRACAAGCVCKASRTSEAVCEDGIDNDGDGVIDCFDPDCIGGVCRLGCACSADAGQLEADCTDGVDNDLDQRIDCADPDCALALCTPPDLYFRCSQAGTPNASCKCNGALQVAETGVRLCNDAIDNDCDGQVDCQEATCEAQSCSPDAGPDCQCSNRGKSEATCNNFRDDDGDGKVDCADDDCGMGEVCRLVDGGVGACTSRMTCQ